MGRRKADYEVKKREIADAAINAIQKHGLSDTTIKNIAKELGYSHGVVQFYFSSKDELLLYAKNLLFDRTFARMEAAAQEHSGLKRILAMAEQHLPTNPASIKMFRLLIMFMGHALGDKKLMRVQQRRTSRGWSIYAKEISTLQATGQLPSSLDAEYLGFAFCSLVDGIAVQVVTSPRKWSTEKQMALVNKFVHMMITP